MANKLAVYRNNALIGTLFDEMPMRFVYESDWQKGQQASISPNISANQAEHSSPAVEAYFENLLPEAGIRELLKLKYQTTTTFGLLSKIGGDTASDITLLPEGEAPKPPQYQAISWQDVADLFTQPLGLIRQIQEEDGLRISLAGAQRKLSVCIDAAGNPLLPLANSPSTHIIKPNIAGIESVWASAINETFVMILAAKLGLDVAASDYQPIAKACVIKRYDRQLNANGQIQRLHQLDFCQLDNKPSTIKYESNGGPSLLRCRQILSQQGIMAADTKRFIQWIFFNLYVGNHDSHAKNLSIYLPANGVRLTPFYDLICTSIYAGLSRTFAFKIGGENKPADIEKTHISAMAESLGFKPQYVLSIAKELATSLLMQLEVTAQEANKAAAAGSEQTMVERLHQHICSNTKSLQKRWF